MVSAHSHDARRTFEDQKLNLKVEHVYPTRRSPKEIGSSLKRFREAMTAELAPAEKIARSIWTGAMRLLPDEILRVVYRNLNELCIKVGMEAYRLETQGENEKASSKFREFAQIRWKIDYLEGLLTIIRI